MPMKDDPIARECRPFSSPGYKCGGYRSTQCHKGMSPEPRWLMP